MALDSRNGLAAAALGRIEAGALDGGSLESLARALDVTPRHLRRAIRSRLGASPVELAQARRLAIARQLVERSRLLLTEVAFASGFASVRRFHAAFAQAYGAAPSTWRRGRDLPPPAQTLILELSHRAAGDWPGALAALRERAVSGVEDVAERVYCRTACIGPHRGWLALYPSARAGLLCVESSLSLARAVSELVDRVETLLECGEFDAFEAGVKTILRHGVEAAAARASAARFAEAFGKPFAVRHSPLTRLFPEAREVSRASPHELAKISIRGGRARAIFERAARSTSKESA